MSVRQDRVQVTVQIDGNQSINELGRLEMQANDLKNTIKGLTRGTDEYNQATSRLREARSRIAELRQEMGLAGMTTRQLRSYARDLNREFENVTSGTQRYNELADQLREVNGVLAEHRRNANGVGSTWDALKSQLSGFAPAALIGAGLAAVTSVAKASFGGNLKLGDELADIAKNTGHTKSEVKGLNDELEKIDTRTDMTSLRKIAAVGGQLDVPKAQIEDFTVAVDKLNVALGDEFDSPEAITKDMGALRNIFSDIKTDKIDQDILKIGNAINELGANGMATGPVVADFASRIGGAGITLGLTSGQVLGLSATLQELNVSTERGGTATVAILQKMAKAPADFAKVAGMGTKEFKKLVNNDIYGAFIKVVEGANKSKAAATNFATILDKLKIDGAGASEVVAKLGSNTALLQQKVDLSNTSLQSTNSIMAEFSTKNETAGAIWDKWTKRFSNYFINSTMLTGLESVMGALDKMFDFTPEAEKLTDAWQEQASAVSNLEKNTLPMLDRYDQLKGKSKLTKEEQIELDKIIAQVAETIPTAITQFDKYGKAMDISSDKARQFIETERSLLKVQNKDAIQAREEELKRIKRDFEALDAYLNGEKGKEKENKNKDKDGFLTKTVSSFTTYGAEMRRTVRLTGDEIETLQKRLAKLQSDKTGTEEWLRRLKGDNLEVPKKAEEVKKEVGDIPEELSDKEKAELEKERERRLKDHATWLAKMAALDMEATDDEILRAIKKAEEKRRVDIAEANQLHISKKERNALLKQIDKTFMAEVVKIEEEGEKKKQEIAKKAAEEALKAAEELAKKKAQIAIAYAQMDLQDAKKTKDPEIIHEAEKNALFVAYKQQALEKWREIEAIDDATATDAEKARKQALLDELYLMEDQYHQNLSALEDSYREAKAAKDRDTAEKVIQYMQQGFQLLADFKSIAIEKEIRKETAAKNKRLKNMDNELKEGRVSQEEYQKAKSTIEANYDTKTRLLKQKAAQSEKNWNIASSIMTGALAVIKAAPNVPLQIATGILAAGATAKIIATPIPEFAKGGGTLEDGSISAGGFARKPYLAMVGEKGSEYIIPNWMLGNPMVADTVGMLEAMRVRGFASGGSTTATAAPQFSETSSSASSAGAAPQWAHELGDSISRLNDILESGISAIFDYDYFEKESTRIKSVQQRAGARKK